MSLPVAALVLLLPWALREGPGWRLWAVAAALYPLGTALTVGLALAWPAETYAVVIPLERSVLALGLAALVAVALRVKGRDGPRGAFWMAHLGLVVALAATDAAARGRPCWTGRPGRARRRRRASRGRWACSWARSGRRWRSGGGARLTRSCVAGRGGGA